MSPNSNNSDNSDNSQSAPPSDVCLLLRAHAESRWLSHQVAPVLREIEQRESLPDEQLGAALAYLEVLWIEACGRARETESARVELDAPGASGDRALTEKARRYDAAVRRLRGAIARRVALLLSVPAHTRPRERISERRIIDRPANS